MKRGQVTLFIIVAIIIIVLIITLIYFSGKYSKDLRKNDISLLSEEGKEVYSKIESCLEEKAYESLDELGKNGGYYSLPNQVNYAGVPYYFFEGKSIYPDINSIEDQISLFMKENTEICLYMINNSDFNIKLKGSINSNIFIEQDQVHFKITYPVELTKNTSATKFDNFDFLIPVRFGKIYNTSLEFIEKDVKSSEGLCLSCLQDIGQENNLEFSGSDYGKGDFIIYVRDSYDSNERRVYLFRFALKYKSI